MLLSFIILLTRFFILRKKSISDKLFAKALKSENDGHFEAAVITYQCALDEIKKSRFQNGLKNKIVEKLKLLHSIIKYEQNLHIVR